MFDKFRQAKELLKLRSQAQTLQKELEQIIHSEEDGVWKVVVNGTQNVTYLAENGEENKQLKDLINKAMKKIQKNAAQKMMEMGGGLSGLLGKM